MVKFQRRNQQKEIQGLDGYLGEEMDLDWTVDGAGRGVGWRTITAKKKERAKGKIGFKNELLLNLSFYDEVCPYLAPLFF